MKINTSSDHFLIKKSDFKDLFNIMKICLFLLFAFAFQLMATNTNAQDAIIELRSNSVTVSQLISEIEKQTDYLVVYSNREVNTSRTVSLKNKSDKVSEYLNQTFSGTDIGYDFEKNYIVLSKKAQQTASTITNLVQTLQQQGKTVRGAVTDSNGEPVIGATIVVKNNPTQGTVTDIDGNFILSNLPENAVLQITYVGMKPQEVSTAGRNMINIIMESDIELLDEVVVVGYGTMKKSDLTGSVTSVQGDIIANKKTMKVGEALQGLLPGVTVTRSGSRPGDDASIRIRGVTTIGNSNPLYLIDGVEGNINNINPNDIESISVLKDAASASIYGSKAAAGVILITTKRAKTNQLNFDYNFEYGFLKPTRLPEFVDAVGYMKAQNEVKWNDNNNTGSEYPFYSKELIDNYQSLHAENPDKYPDTDWTGLLLKNNAPRQSHLLGITAGSNNVRSKISFGFDQIDGLYDGVSYNRITVRANNDFTIHKYLTASIDFNFAKELNEQTATSTGVFMGGMGVPPFAAMWSDGRIAEGQTTYNPYARVKFGGYDNTWNERTGGRLSIDFTPIEGLKFSGIFAPNINNVKSKRFAKAIPYTRFNEPDVIAGYINGAKTTNLREGRNDSYNTTTQLLANYIKTLSTHNFNIMAGYENYYSFYESMGAFSDEFLLSTYPYLNLANKNVLDVNGGASEYASRSFFGRFMYNYSNKYLLQANMRYDGSSRFHEDYRWGLFPSLSVGWVLTEESFLESLANLNFFKIRASWGTLGNERIGTYPYQSTIGFGNSVLFTGNNNIVQAQNAGISKYAIQNISWEKTKSYNIGFDANLFSNLWVTFDYFQKDTEDMLLPLEIPNYMGVSNPDQNAGKMHTEGWEFEARYSNKFGGLNYSLSLNLSDYKSVMGDLGGTEFLGNQVRFEGSEFNEWYGYKSDGLYQTQEEVDNSVVLNAQTKVGDIKYIDISGPDGIPDGKISPEYDKVLLGGSMPRYLYGGTLNVDYKNFDFMLVVQGVGKKLSQLTNHMTFEMDQNVHTYLVEEMWSHHKTPEENLNAKYPRISTSAHYNNYGTFSDYWLINGAYLRIKNISLGYQIPHFLSEKLILQNARVYVNISDPLSFDHFPTGWDPETPSGGAYWITSSILFGISINF